MGNAPANPADGDRWFDLDADCLKVYVAATSTWEVDKDGPPREVSSSWGEEPPPPPKEPPRWLNDPEQRATARRMRDWQWTFMEHVDTVGTLWCCWWNKDSHFSAEEVAATPDLWVFSLINGVETLNWINAHPDWWTVGEWVPERYAAPVSLTDAGRKALAERHLYDMEPVVGGLVEPGWQALPAEKETSDGHIEAQ